MGYTTSYLEQRLVSVWVGSEQIYPSRCALRLVRLKKSGLIIDEFDILIGATAIANNMILVTRNIKHFERLENIKIDNWIKD